MQGAASIPPRKGPVSAGGAHAVPVVVALGSNRCSGRHGRPEAVLRAAARALADAGLVDVRLSPILRSAPIGPSRRTYANAALLALWAGDAPALLALLKRTERCFGRRRGQRWGARVLDLDLIAFGNLQLRAPGLVVPHPRMAERDFVLRPMLALWPHWRHPATGLSVRHMLARLKRRHPLNDGQGG